MKVTSPVGEFPFTIKSVRLRGKRLVVLGQMGSWPADIEVGVRDLLPRGQVAWMSAAGFLVLAVLRHRLRNHD